jgi:NADPH2:quinone reductase
MRAMRAEQFSDYEALKLVDLPKPAVTDGKVLAYRLDRDLVTRKHRATRGEFL